MNSMSAISLINRLLSDCGNNDPHNAVNNSTNVVEPPELPVDGSGANSPPHNAVPAAHHGSTGDDGSIADDSLAPDPLMKYMHRLSLSSLILMIMDPLVMMDPMQMIALHQMTPNEVHAQGEFEQPEQPARLAADQLIASHPVKKK